MEKSLMWETPVSRTCLAAERGKYAGHHFFASFTSTTNKFLSNQTTQRSKFMNNIWIEEFSLVSKRSESRRPEFSSSFCLNINPSNLLKKLSATLVWMERFGLELFLIRSVVICNKPCKISLTK